MRRRQSSGRAEAGARGDAARQEPPVACAARGANRPQRARAAEVRRPGAGAGAAASRATPRSSRSSRACRGSPASSARSSPRATSRTSGAFRPSPWPSRSPTSCAASSPTPPSAPPSCPSSPSCSSTASAREAFRLASALLLLIVTVLGAITVLFVVGAGVIMPLFVGDKLAPASRTSRSGSRGSSSRSSAPGGQRPARRDPQRLRPLHDPGAQPAGLERRDHRVPDRLSQVLEGDDQLYGYAVGVLGGHGRAAGDGGAAAAAAGLPLRAARRQVRDPRVRRVLVLMLPVTLGLGLINFNLLVNSALGSLVSETRRAPSTRPSASTCCPRASSAWRSRPCCSRRSAGWPRAATSTPCAL